MGKIPVSALFENCRKMIEENWGYIFGTAGEKWTAAKQERIESQYSDDDPNWGGSVKYGSKWIDHMVTDCSGVMVYIWRQYGLSIPHGSSSMVRQGYIIDCGTEPHPGWAALVDPTPETDDNKHIGIVMDDGVTVFEAKGANAGCVYSKVTDSKWTKFGRFKDVDYSGENEMKPPYYALVVTSSGSLNIRSGPSTQFSVVGSVPKGEKVIVKIPYSDWSFIDYNGLQGYSSNKYLDPIEEIQPEPQPEEEVVIRVSASTAKEYCRVLNEIASLFENS